MKTNKAPLINWIALFVTGIIVSTYTFCNGEVSVSGNVVGGCYANEYFIPYGWE